MKSWKDIYDVIAEDANGTTIYRPATEEGAETMCVMGGLALVAGLDIRTGGVYTSEAIDFVVKEYPLTLDQCGYLVKINDSYVSTKTRRTALIRQVRKYEAQEVQT